MRLASSLNRLSNFTEFSSRNTARKSLGMPKFRSPRLLRLKFNWKLRFETLSDLRFRSDSEDCAVHYTVCTPCMPVLKWRRFHNGRFISFEPQALFGPLLQKALVFNPIFYTFSPAVLIVVKQTAPSGRIQCAHATIRRLPVRFSDPQLGLSCLNSRTRQTLQRSKYSCAQHTEKDRCDGIRLHTLGRNALPSDLI